MVIDSFMDNSSTIPDNISDNSPGFFEFKLIGLLVKQIKGSLSLAEEINISPYNLNLKILLIGK